MVSALIVKIMGAVFRIPLANMLGGTGMGYFSAAYGIFMPVYAVSVTGLWQLLRHRAGTVQGR